MNRSIAVFIGILIVAGICCLWLAGCNTPQAATATGMSVVDSAAVRTCLSVNTHIVDTAVTLLQSGDIVLRRGIGAESTLLAMMNRKDKTYSHCGIVMVEDGYPFVYHSIGGEDNPDARLRRDSASFFFSPVHNLAIAIVRYDYDSVKVGRLRDIVGAYYKQRPRFDMKFDLATDSELYCSEFVYKAVNRAVADTSYIGTSSMRRGRFVGIDDLYLDRHARVVWQTKFKQYLCSQK